MAFLPQSNAKRKATTMRQRAGFGAMGCSLGGGVETLAGRSGLASGRLLSLKRRRFVLILHRLLCNFEVSARAKLREKNVAILLFLFNLDQVSKLRRGYPTGVWATFIFFYFDFPFMKNREVPRSLWNMRRVSP